MDITVIGRNLGAWGLICAAACLVAGTVRAAPPAGYVLTCVAHPVGRDVVIEIE